MSVPKLCAVRMYTAAGLGGVYASASDVSMRAPSLLWAGKLRRARGLEARGDEHGRDCVDCETREVEFVVVEGCEASGWRWEALDAGLAWLGNREQSRAE